MYSWKSRSSKICSSSSTKLKWYHKKKYLKNCSDFKNIFNNSGAFSIFNHIVSEPQPLDSVDMIFSSISRVHYSKTHLRNLESISQFFLWIFNFIWIFSNFILKIAPIFWFFSDFSFFLYFSSTAVRIFFRMIYPSFHSL